jgi:ATP-dependent Clp protease ATP-binding subunit ClpA
VDVNEPSVDETFEILKGLRKRFEEHYGLRYSTAALKTAAELSARYITDRFLPDKAIDVIDEAGAYQRLQPEVATRKLLGVKEMEEIVAEDRRAFPAQTCSASDKECTPHAGRRSAQRSLRSGRRDACLGDGR